MADELVVYSTQGPAAIIRLNNPTKRNPMSKELLDQLSDAVKKATDDAAVRAIIITGTGPAFCAGMDLSEARAALARLSHADVGTPWTEAQHGEQLLDQIYNCGKPTIAALNGVAAGNGAGLASVCDIVIMSSQARIGYPEMRSGIQAAMVVLHLMRLVGERIARYLLLTGELQDAQSALNMGLVNQVVEPDKLMEAALACAGKIALNAPQAEAQTKLLLRRFSGQALGLQMTDYTAVPHLEGEARVGLEAFFARKRPPWAPEAPAPAAAAGKA